ncbi:hypothetical protein FV229_12545 [Methylobacterium sp. WL120]|nr:hypothetical protein FV229_12545 [Methylobacterium sp. WL120]
MAIHFHSDPDEGFGKLPRAPGGVPVRIGSGGSGGGSDLVRWRAIKGERDLDPDSLVFIDETAAAMTMVRPYDRYGQGERCRICMPYGHD